MKYSYIYEQFKALSQDKRSKYQSVTLTLLHGRIDTNNYNRAFAPKISIEIVNAQNGNRERKYVVFSEEEIADILYWINTKETELQFYHKFNESSTGIYFSKYAKGDKRYYIIRISSGKNNSVSYAFSPSLFRYIFNKIQQMLIMESYAMTWERKRNNQNNANQSLPDDIDSFEQDTGSANNFDEEPIPDQLPEDIQF